MIKIERVKSLNGWYYTLTDDVNKEVWSGIDVDPKKDNPDKTIQNFIRDRKQKIVVLQEQIEEAEKL